MRSIVPISELKHYVDQEIEVAGWVDTLRDQKRMQFLIARDHTGRVQAINEKRGDELERTISALTPESVLYATGRVVSNQKVKLNQLEIVLSGIDILSIAQTPIPINETAALEARLDWRYIDLRKPSNRLIFLVQTEIEAAMRAYWLEHGFIEIHSPKLVEGATESGAELFQLEYFGKTASLAQSPQFYKQMAMAAGFNRVFEIGPVFRANPSFTSRHDTEFTSIDMEISWIESHEDVMAFEERWLQYALGIVAAKYGKEIKEHFGVELGVPSVPFPRVSMKEAYDILQSKGYEPPEKGDLDPGGERTLAQHIKEKHGHEFVFVKDYPISVRPFYHMRHAGRPDTTRSFDLIWNGLEITTGAQREHRYEPLYQQAIEKGVNPDSIKHYLEFFKHGCPPHGGFGMGLTRILMNVLGLRNVREVTFLYRGPNRLVP
ncbi:aspartate--tRNA(Asn) ligase [Candidatus Woesearchaeota archaeon]|nr:aspartate--tRNA(Asn) ligase [Candidatus Woesearchaeota archaeon]